WAALVLIPVLAFVVTAPGCSKGEDKPKKQKPQGDGDDGGKEELKPIEAKETGTLEGTISLTGAPTNTGADYVAGISGLKTQKDKDTCTAGIKEGDKERMNKWRSKDGKLQDVVIYVKAPDGKYFKVSADQAKPKEASIDQPHCAFEPHVVTMFTKYRDGA